jgi:hypothetical protein
MLLPFVARGAISATGLAATPPENLARKCSETISAKGVCRLEPCDSRPSLPFTSSEADENRLIYAGGGT